MTKVFALALVVVMLLSVGCGVANLGPAATADGLLSAVRGAQGTFIMASDQLYMVAWPQSHIGQQGQYGFAVFNRGTGTAVKQFMEMASCTGTGADCKTMSGLVNYLKTVGWVEVSSLPAALSTQIRSLAKHFGMAGTAPTFTLFLLPYGPAFEMDLGPPMVDS